MKLFLLLALSVPLCGCPPPAHATARVPVLETMADRASAPPQLADASP